MGTADSMNLRSIELARTGPVGYAGRRGERPWCVATWRTSACRFDLLELNANGDVLTGRLADAVV